MLIPLTRPSPSSTPTSLPPNLIKLGTTLMLLELQGTLDVCGTPDAGEGGGVIGELRMIGEKPTLQVGHHLLEGKIVTLPKPLAVLRKQSRSGPSSTPHPNPTPDNEMDPSEPPTRKDAGDEMDVDAVGECTTSYEIVEVVRKKVVFSRRPALTIGKAGASVAGAVKKG